MRADRAYSALARALTPPGGDVRGFDALGLPVPDVRVLEAEHVALFGRAGRAQISPYEVARIGGDLHEVLADLSLAGFTPDPGFRDRWDHVCVGLAALAVLSERESGTRAPEGRLTTFFRRRIEPWVPAFFDELAASDEFPVHRALGLRAGMVLDASIARLGDGRRARPCREPTPEPSCVRCGKPVGFSLPKRPDLLPPWGLVCLPCRVRADLRRFGT